MREPHLPRPHLSALGRCQHLQPFVPAPSAGRTPHFWARREQKRPGLTRQPPGSRQVRYYYSHFKDQITEPQRSEYVARKQKGITDGRITIIRTATPVNHCSLWLQTNRQIMAESAESQTQYKEWTGTMQIPGAQSRGGKSGIALPRNHTGPVTSELLRRHLSLSVKFL